MVQLDLFEESPALSRHTDKPTSHEAGDGVRHKLNQLQQRCLLMLGNLELTAIEVATACSGLYGGMAESYRKRMHELARDGHVTELPPRECSVTGKNSTVYKRKT